MQSFCVAVTCVACGFVERIYVVPMDYVRWNQGVHAQDAFPYLTADERDCLISNMCLGCIDEMYQDAREEDEEEWLPEYDDMLMPEADDPAYASDYYVDQDCD